MPNNEEQYNYSIIKTVRQAKGLTQEEIARKIDITLRNYQYIEKGTNIPNVITALKICKLLNVSPFQLWEIKD